MTDVTDVTEQKGLSALQERINASWNETAARAKGQPHHTVRDEEERQIWLDVLRGLLTPAPADILDIGTGTGFLALRCAELGHRVSGVDLSEGMLADGRAIAATRAAAGMMVHPPVFRIGDAMDPPLPPSTLDVVANRNVLWTLLDPAKAFRNWWTLLRPGGRIVAIHGGTEVKDRSDPARRTELPDRYYTEELAAQLPGMRWLPTMEPARQAAEQAGFTDITVTHVDALERYARERENRKRFWLALTALKPAP